MRQKAQSVQVFIINRNALNNIVKWRRQYAINRPIDSAVVMPPVEPQALPIMLVPASSKLTPQVASDASTKKTSAQIIGDEHGAQRRCWSWEFRYGRPTVLEKAAPTAPWSARRRKSDIIHRSLSVGLFSTLVRRCGSGLIPRLSSIEKCARKPQTRRQKQHARRAKVSRSCRRREPALSPRLGVCGGRQQQHASSFISSEAAGTARHETRGLESDRRCRARLPSTGFTKQQHVFRRPGKAGTSDTTTPTMPLRFCACPGFELLRQVGHARQSAALARHLVMRAAGTPMTCASCRSAAQ